MQSKRVIATISMMVRTPRPSLPTSQASAPRSSVSLDALETVAHLALQAQHLQRVLAAVGAPARHQEARQPGGGLRQHRKASHIGAETKYLWPTSS
jgi:hypothetical protein